MKKVGAYFHVPYTVIEIIGMEKTQAIGQQ